MTLGNGDGWEKTIGSLAKHDSDGNDYSYYVLETKNASITDAYQVTPAAGDELRVLTIRDTGIAEPICKVDGQVFFTLSSAMAYITDYEIQEASIEMLVDYIVPSTDILVIPNGYNVTLTTASTDDETDPFRPPADDPNRTEAIIYRYKTHTETPMITNQGSFAVQKLTLDGNGVQAHCAMIDSESDLVIGEKATLRNAINSGNGGAILMKSGKVTIRRTGAALFTPRAVQSRCPAAASKKTPLTRVARSIVRQP